MSRLSAPGKINVVCRFRPLNAIERQEAKDSPFVLDEDVVEDKIKRTAYTLFDTVLGPSASQQDAYKSSAANCVDAVMHGFNAGMFAYGQSGGGKSYSLLGPEGSDMFSGVKKGVIPRALDELLSRAREDKEMETKISMRFYELYGDGVYDLLQRGQEAYRYDDSGMLGGVFPIPGGKTPENRHMQKLSKLTIGTAEEACGIIAYGNTHRRFRSMPANPVSSRSHAIIQLQVERCALNTDERFVSNLYFADLMGSEALSDGSLLETSKVNMDLSVLERVILALAHGGEHLPYRECALTWVLRTVLTHNCCTTVLVTCSPHEKQYTATTNTLEFGTQCKGVKLRVKQAAERLTPAQMESRLAELRAELEALKQDKNSLSRQLESSLSKLGVTLAAKQEAERRAVGSEAKQEALECALETVEAELRELKQLKEIAAHSHEQRAALLSSSVENMRSKEKSLNAVNLALRASVVADDAECTREQKLDHVVQRMLRKTECIEEQESPSAGCTAQHELEAQMAALINQSAQAKAHAEQLELSLQEHQAAAVELQLRVETLSLTLGTRSTQLGIARGAKATIQTENAALKHELAEASSRAMHSQQLLKDLESSNEENAKLASELQSVRAQLQQTRGTGAVQEPADPDLLVSPETCEAMERAGFGEQAQLLHSMHASWHAQEQQPPEDTVGKLQDLKAQLHKYQARAAAAVFSRLCGEYLMARELSTTQHHLEQQAENSSLLQARLESLRFTSASQRHEGVGEVATQIGAAVRALGQCGTQGLSPPTRYRGASVLSLDQSTRYRGASVLSPRYRGASVLSEGPISGSATTGGIESAQESELRAHVEALQAQIETDRSWQRWHLVKENLVTLEAVADAVDRAGLGEEAGTLREVASQGEDCEAWTDQMEQQAGKVHSVGAAVRRAGLVGEADAIEACSSTLLRLSRQQSSSTHPAQRTPTTTTAPTITPKHASPTKPDSEQSVLGAPGGSELLPGEQAEFVAQEDKGACSACVMM